eukprot:GHUV01031499.1.p1 GENE.GHUV01031499.1~~GHUV01031499.1.p1  ORF type:complete len:110 (-),score=18.10 GHUV01031499.1:716-1045(-)
MLQSDTLRAVYSWHLLHQAYTSHCPFIVSRVAHLAAVLVWCSIGMKSSRLPQVLPGAGNFRRMAGLPVYGVAMCTMDGIRNVLDAVMKEQAHRGAKKVRLMHRVRCKQC